MKTNKHDSVGDPPNLLNIIQASSDYLATTERLYGVDPWPLENVESKQPQIYDIDQLRHAVKSLTVYFVREWAEQEVHIEDQIASLTAAKVHILERYASQSLTIDQKDHLLTAKEFDRYLDVKKKHSAMYLEDVNFMKEVQVQVADLVLLEAKIATDQEHASESDTLKHERLQKDVAESHSSFVAKAVERKESIAREDEEATDELEKFMKPFGLEDYSPARITKKLDLMRN